MLPDLHNSPIFCHLIYIFVLDDDDDDSGDDDDIYSMILWSEVVIVGDG